MSDVVAAVRQTLGRGFEGKRLFPTVTEKEKTMEGD